MSGLFGNALTNLAIGAAHQADTNWNDADTEEGALLKQRQAVVDKVSGEQNTMAKQAQDIARKQQSYMQLYGIPEDMAYGVATNPNVEKMSAPELSDYVKSLKPTGQSIPAQPAQQGQQIMPGVQQNKGLIGSMLTGPGLHADPVNGVSTPAQPQRGIYSPDGNYKSQAQRQEIIKTALTSSNGCNDAFQSTFQALGGRPEWLPQNFTLPPNKTNQNEQFTRTAKSVELATNYVKAGGDPKSVPAYIQRLGGDANAVAGMDFSVFSPVNNDETKTAKMKAAQYESAISDAFPGEDPRAVKYLASQFAAGVYKLVQDSPDNTAHLYNTVTGKPVDTDAEKAIMDSWLRQAQQRGDLGNNQGPANHTDVLGQVRQNESGNDYTAKNPNSTASGAYGFINETWSRLAKESGNPEYANMPASAAPKDVQDKVAQYAAAHYDPNSDFLWKASAPQGGYQVASNQGGANNTDTAQTPTVPPQTSTPAPAAPQGQRLDDVFKINRSPNMPDTFYKNTYAKVYSVPAIDKDINVVKGMINKDPEAAGVIGEIVKRAVTPGVNVAGLIDQVMGSNYANSIADKFSIGDRKALEVALTQLQVSQMKYNAAIDTNNGSAGMGTGGAEIQEMWHRVFENGDMQASAPGLISGLSALQNVYRNHFMTDIGQIGNIPDLSNVDAQQKTFVALRRAGFDTDGAHEVLGMMLKDQHGGR